MASVCKDYVEILKPRTDKREYRRIVLKNSLQVLLISDPETDKCAASMNVGVGFFSDPDGLEGLAHFLEHMLFYASEKYPLEDSYSKYIAEHGGRTNAFTSSERTNFHFDVNTDGFEEALDRFARFFIKPLMSADATTREIKAVDSGNWDSLDVRPKAKGVDTRQELLKFYEEYYSANLMHLVVYSKESPDEIQSLVEDMFQEIRNSGRSFPSFPGQPCSSEHLQILVRAVPIKEGNKLRIVWPITPAIHYYKEGPCRYLGHLIGHEGEGSLFYILKKLGWATGLYASEGAWTLEFSFFEVVIDLTDAGHDHMQDIVGLLFKYIQLLRQSGVCKWIFDELLAVCETGFHYQDKVQPIYYVVNIASEMRMYPPKDWLVRSSMPANFNQDIIQMVLNELSLDKVRIFWESKKFEGLTDMVEPWYGTAYSIEKVTTSMIQEWMSMAPNENVHLPAPNIFIPTDFSLKDPQEKIKYPVLLRNSSYSRVWYKPDIMFSSPKACVTIDFNCPYASNSPEAQILTSIFAQLVTLDGYNHKLRILLETVVDKIAKFEVKPDRFSVIKERVTQDYQNLKFQQPYEQAMYYCSLLLEDCSWPWMEKLEGLPNVKAEDLAKFAPMMLSRAFLECYIAGNIERAEAESMIQHVEDIFFKGSNPISFHLHLHLHFICCSFQPHFHNICSFSLLHFAATVLLHLTNRVVKLERGMNYFYSKEGLNPSDENSALLHYIQVHRDDFMLNVKLQLFALIAKQPTFHQLRSVEQLGYITVLWQRNDFGIHGLQFIIQSTVKGPEHIDLRVQAFLQMFETQLYKMTQDEFKVHISVLLDTIQTSAELVVTQSNVNALIDMKLDKHKNLREESRFYWTEISDGTLKFDRIEAEVAALRQLTQPELIDFFNEHIKVGAPQKRTLSVRVVGKEHLVEYRATKSEVVQPAEIDDILSFRKSLPLYGSFRGGAGLVKL
ncbi:hypothetical protein SLEP1_g41140 [Rubroshorea leprosula]|uniref:Insulin-degrading enzyme-like 1, peroxisomal n=1 Tax=Rubroshorea leprosula TaxID=152421 RepID=A0AAV5L6H1_9ROSI|nr:hypothetical protein SLEP1_g41140 [Rubroshorea leprosula]